MSYPGHKLEEFYPFSRDAVGEFCCPSWLGLIVSEKRKDITSATWSYHWLLPKFTCTIKVTVLIGKGGFFYRTLYMFLLVCVSSISTYKNVFDQFDVLFFPFSVHVSWIHGHFYRLLLLIRECGRKSESNQGSKGGRLQARSVIDSDDKNRGNGHFRIGQKTSPPVFCEVGVLHQRKILGLVTGNVLSSIKGLAPKILKKRRKNNCYKYSHVHTRACAHIRTNSQSLKTFRQTFLQTKTYNTVLKCIHICVFNTQQIYKIYLCTEFSKLNIVGFVIIQVEIDGVHRCVIVVGSRIRSPSSHPARSCLCFILV